MATNTLSAWKTTSWRTVPAVRTVEFAFERCGITLTVERGVWHFISTRLNTRDRFERRPINPIIEKHFADPLNAIRRLDSHLARVNLPFDLKRQLRELTFPELPGVPASSLIYYFVPETNRGSDQKRSADPLHDSFLRTADGIGINLGCPVRLLRAFDALAQLPDEHQAGPKAEIRRAAGHLAAVEELLWLVGWKNQTNPRRGGQLPGMRGDIDWAFDANTYPILLEAKFRASDWPRLVERGSFIHSGGGFLSNALHKFAHPSQSRALHVVGITLFDNVTDEIIELVVEELKVAPQIHVVVFRSLIWMTHVISLRHRPCKRVLELLSVPSMKDFPVCGYNVISNRAERDQRVALRPTTSGGDIRNHSVYYYPLIPIDVPFFPAEDSYRINVSYGPDGEPIFTVIPKWIV